jgi:hypothetical protein
VPRTGHARNDCKREKRCGTGLVTRCRLRDGSVCSLTCQKRDAFRASLIAKNLLPVEDTRRDKAAEEDARIIQEYADQFSKVAFGAESVTVTTVEGFGDDSDDELERAQVKPDSSDDEEPVVAPERPKHPKKRHHHGKKISFASKHRKTNA